jgi:hypothetical protein
MLLSPNKQFLLFLIKMKIKVSGEHLLWNLDRIVAIFYMMTFSYCSACLIFVMLAYYLYQSVNLITFWINTMFKINMTGSNK